MYLTEISMQLISMLFILIVGVYFVALIFTFYRKEKRRTGDQSIKRYTFEYCIKEMEKLDKYAYNSGDTFRDGTDVFFSILNVFDRLAVGVYTEVLSEEVVIMYFGSYMWSFYKDNRFKLFEVREAKNDAELYANYEQFMEELHFRKERLKHLNNRRAK